jgi:hypothetical protein
LLITAHPAAGIRRPEHQTHSHQMQAVMTQTASLTARDIITLYRNRNSLTASIGRLSSQAGIDDAESLLFTPLPEREILVARPLDERVDGRSSTHGRALMRLTNNDGDIRGVRATFPKADLEAAFSLDADAVATSKDDGRSLALYTGTDADGEPLLAFADAPRLDIPTDSLNDEP